MGAGNQEVVAPDTLVKTISEHGVFKRFPKGVVAGPVESGPKGNVSAIADDWFGNLAGYNLPTTARKVLLDLVVSNSAKRIQLAIV
jgi:hypothetical protein